LDIQEIVLQDENFHLHKLVKVKDTTYDPIKKDRSILWFWIYSETSDFFHFELWDQLDRAVVNQNITHKDYQFKVVSINDNKKINYS